MRRRSWDDKFLRIFRWMGLTTRLVTTWSDLTDEPMQRIMQALTLLDQLEVFGPDVIQRIAAKAMSISDPGSVPDGWLPKSQRKSGNDSVAGNSGATDGTGQGSDDGTGSTPDDHDDDDT